MKKLQSKDLRIGNLVEYDGKIFEIDIISNELPTLNTDEFGIGVVTWNDLKPIEVSEEYLLLLDMNSEFSLGKLHFYSDDGSLSVWLFKNGRVDVRIRGIDIKNSNRTYNSYKYVHQLQNLYFALTGEELVMKDNPTLK